DPHRARRPNAVAMQKHHDLTAYLLLGPGSHDATRAHGANAINLAQAIWLPLDDVEHLLAEGAQKLLGVDRADAANHPRRQIPFDSLDRSGRRGLEELGLELLPMRAVVKPLARRSDPLASGYDGGMANHCDKLAVATDLHSDDTKAVLRVLIGDALDHPGEHLPIRRGRLPFSDVPCVAADASLHLCAVGAFEIDLPSSIEAMQLSSDSDEAPYAEESTDSEGIIRTCTASYPSSLPRCRTGYAAGIGLADQFSMGLPE